MHPELKNAIILNGLAALLGYCFGSIGVGLIALALQKPLPVPTVSLKQTPDVLRIHVTLP